LRIAQRLIMKLAIASGMLPQTLVINGVNEVETAAASGGGYADIYRARYMGKQVAMKKFRVFETYDRQALHHVRTPHPWTASTLGIPLMIVSRCSVKKRSCGKILSIRMSYLS